MVKLGISYESLQKMPKQLVQKMVLLYRLELEKAKKK